MRIRIIFEKQFIWIFTYLNIHAHHWLSPCNLAQTPIPNLWMLDDLNVLILHPMPHLAEISVGQSLRTEPQTTAKNLIPSLSTWLCILFLKIYIFFLLLHNLHIYLFFINSNRKFRIFMPLLHVSIDSQRF